MRVWRMRSRASSTSSGGSATALSLTTSVATPPAPNRMTRPEQAILETPSKSSCAFGRTIMGCTVKPSSLARLAGSWPRGS